MRCDLKLRLLLSGGWETILSSGSHLGREITFSLNLHLTDPSVPGPELTSVHGHRQSWEMDFLISTCLCGRQGSGESDLWSQIWNVKSRDRTQSPEAKSSVHSTLYKV